MMCHYPDQGGATAQVAKLVTHIAKIVTLWLICVDLMPCSYRNLQCTGVIPDKIDLFCNLFQVQL